MAKISGLDIWSAYEGMNGTLRPEGRFFIIYRSTNMPSVCAQIKSNALPNNALIIIVVNFWAHTTAGVPLLASFVEDGLGPEEVSCSGAGGIVGGGVITWAFGSLHDSKTIELLSAKAKGELSSTA